MGNVGKIAIKVALTLGGAFVLGYTEYRIKGGKPIHKLYKEVKNERLATEAAAVAQADGTPIKAEGTVK